MLTRLPKALRLWLATAFVGLYSLCVLLPAAALAFNDAPCVLKQHGVMQPHVHASSVTHQHAAHEHADHQHPGDAQHSPAAATDSGNDAQPPAPKCCGMAFFAAVAPEPGFMPAAPALAGRHGLAINQALAGLPPDELIRPPKSLS
jgi:hypothetical protein